MITNKEYMERLLAHLPVDLAAKLDPTYHHPNQEEDDSV